VVVAPSLGSAAIGRQIDLIFWCCFFNSRGRRQSSRMQRSGRTHAKSRRRR